MAAVRSLQVSLKPDSGSDSDSEPDSDRDVREAEPMEVEGEEGELVSVNRSLKELLPDTSRRYENRAGAFITGIDVNSKEAIERKEKRAQRFHFQSEESAAQRTVLLDKDMMKKAIPRLRLEAVHVTGVDDMSTHDIFGYFKQYPPAHIEWIDDASCNVVWLDDNTSVRALINTSRLPEPGPVATETGEEPGGRGHEEPGGRGHEEPERPGHEEEPEGRGQEEPEGRGQEELEPRGRSQGRLGQRSDDDDDDEEEEGQVEEGGEGQGAEPVRTSEDKDGDTETKDEDRQVADLSAAERESLLRNDLRPVIKPFKGNKLLLRFATQDDRKELGAARRSRYYMKYGNPNYGGMKGILSNSWKRRFHNRRIQRDVIKTKKPLIGDSLGHTPPYTHRHSADLVNLPEEPIKEEEEEEEGEDEDMDSDDRVVEYRERGEKGGGRGPGPAGGTGPAGGAGLRTRAERSPSPWSESDEMDYDLELKMISTPSPKKSKKMTMYADELDTHLKGIRNRLGGAAQSCAESSSPPKVTDVRQLLEEKRQRPGPAQLPPVVSQGKTDVRQRLGKRPRSPSPPSPPGTPPPREPIRDIHRRLGVANQEGRGLTAASSKDRKSGLWSRLGPVDADGGRRVGGRGGGRREGEQQEEGEDEEEDTALQRVWGNMIKQKQERGGGAGGGGGAGAKRSRLDNLPSLQIEISRDSSDESDA